MSGITNLRAHMDYLAEHPRHGTCEYCGANFEDGSPGQRRRFCSDRHRRAACAERCRAVCPACGVPLAAGSSWGSRPVEQCDACCRLDAAASRAGHLIAIYLLWQSGWGRSLIAERVGMTPGSVSKEVSTMRTKGVTLDYRRQDARNPDILARMWEGRDAARHAA